MPRRARIVAAGYPHHIVQRGNNKAKIFFDNHDRITYLSLLKKYISECGLKLHAYCLMDNHVHLLVVPLYDYSIARAMQKLSLTFTQYFNKKYKRTGRLWECRFHSSLIDRETYLWSVCRYIERNPVSAHIVDNPIQYKWSSAGFNTTDLKSSFIEPIWQSLGEREEYSRLLNTPANETGVEKIRKATYREKPLGTEEFLNQIAKTLGIVINMRPRGRPLKLKK